MPPDIYIFNDGVLVGDGPPTFEYCQVETLQVVWTHNCEHGVVRGRMLQPYAEKQDNDPQQGDGALNRLLHLSTGSFYNEVEFGPEQLLARIPVQWINETDCQTLVEVGDDVWREHTLEW